MTIENFKNHKTIKIKVDKNDINFIKAIIIIRAQINQKELIENKLMIRMSNHKDMMSCFQFFNI
jgi:hypothetical protein